MIDMFALLVSTGMMGLVVFFAIRLNREREWFEKPSPPRPAPAHPAVRATPPGPGRRPSPRAIGRNGRAWRRDA